MATDDTASPCCRRTDSSRWTRSIGASFAAALGIAVLALPASAGAHARACAHARAPIIAASRRQLQASVVCLINRQRGAHHLPALRESRQLNRSAQGWTDVMVRHHEFTHGANFAARISAAGFDWSTAGENIAAGFETPASVVQAWMGSPGHCRNILTPSFADVGTGVAQGTVVGAGHGTWTQDFGLTMGARAPSGNWGPADGCPY